MNQSLLVMIFMPSFFMDRHIKSQAYPSFMHIVFPNKDCTEYWPDRLDLMYKFAEIREQVPAIEDIPIPQPAKLRTIEKSGENT